MRRETTIVVGVALVLLTSACGQSGSEKTGRPSGDAAADCDVDAALSEIASGGALSDGIGGIAPTSAAEVEVSEEQAEKIRALGASAIISMHFGGNEWSDAQVAGATEEFERLGIEVEGVTYAESSPDQQVSDIETLLRTDPDILLSVPTDAVSTASAYQRAADAGVEIVFMDYPAEDMVAGEDYASYVSADNYANGVVSAHLMAEALGCQGEVGIVRYNDPSYQSVQQRYEGFKATIEEEYPDISIVADDDIAGPDFAGNAEKTASAMLLKNPGIGGIWGFFDIPAEGIKQAARAAGRDDLVVTTVDLGLNVALDIAEGGHIYGLGAQRPYDQGLTEARLAALSLIGEQVPPYVVLPALPVDADNVLDAWSEVYHVPAPEELEKAAR